MKNFIESIFVNVMAIFAVIGIIAIAIVAGGFVIAVIDLGFGIDNQAIRTIGFVLGVTTVIYKITSKTAPKRRRQFA